MAMNDGRAQIDEVVSVKNLIFVFGFKMNVFVNNLLQIMIEVLNEMVFYHSVLGHSIRIIKVDSVGDSTPELSSPYQAVNQIQVPVPAAATIPPQALPEAVPSPVHLLRENCAAESELVFFN
ncbi:uncharacterized protein LOC128092703 [Culex pipiens pallens]|uniref:uncharacterized protein LOC128092703 n=1 Tax=Culex pipiens pallens TaxID=42434 RepID=UPI0022A9FCB5|nr:uncharacterized protein LOC128092703 [Culex pipiens pallens]